MTYSTTLLFLVITIIHVHAAPQFITFKDGKLGVNFNGYHAGVGFGGLLGGNTGGGLFAEAGTPHGQSARAGLGGNVDEQGRASGGLFAGATAGGNVQAAAGLAGGVNENKAEGGGFAAAQAGQHVAGSSLGGQSSVEGSAGYTFSSNKKSHGPIYKEVQISNNIDSINEVQSFPKTTTNFEVKSNVDTVTKIDQPVVVKEVYVQPAVAQKEIIITHTKPRHHLRKVAYISDHAVVDAIPPPPPPPHHHHPHPPPLPATIIHYNEPKIQKRIDVHVDGSATDQVAKNSEANINTSFTKQVSFQRNPTFFQDIFNIPISTLKAVSSFLGNTAANTNVSIQKSASINADTDTKSTTNDQSSLTKSSAAHVSVETPTASKFIDDIFSIPINTLGAVNKFLENNVPARKTVQVGDGSAEGRIRGPAARRRANKRVVVIEEVKSKEEDPKE